MRLWGGAAAREENLLHGAWPVRPASRGMRMLSHYSGGLSLHQLTVAASLLFILWGHPVIGVKAANAAAYAEALWIGQRLGHKGLLKHAEALGGQKA